MKVHPAFLDIIFITAFLFINTTLLLLEYGKQNPEVSLPAISLAETKQSGTSDGNKVKKPLYLSIKKNNNKNIYFLNDKEITFNELGLRLNKTKPSAIELRVAKDVLYDVVNKVFNKIISAGIAEVSFVALSKG